MKMLEREMRESMQRRRWEGRTTSKELSSRTTKDREILTRWNHLYEIDQNERISTHDGGLGKE